MNTNLHTKVVKICTALMLLLSINSFAQGNVAAWTFNNIGTAPNIDVALAANSGNLSGIAYLYADGTNGSSTWTTTVSDNELTSFVGTTMNDPEMPQNASQSLGLVRGTGNSADGKSIVIRYSMIGNIDPILSYAVRGTANSFTSLQWSWSTDGTTWTNVGGSAVTNNNAFAVNSIDMSSVNQLDNAQVAYLKLTVSGGSGSAAENTRLDNIVISATQLPPPTQIMLAQCGTELPTISSSIFAENLSNTTAYRFEVTNMTTNQIQIIDRSARWFKLTMLPSYEYATTYKIRVDRQVNGVWSGYYGYSCEVSTPNITGENGMLSVAADQCGTTLAAMNTNIFSNNIASVTGYRFRITNMSNSSAPNQVQTIDRSLRWFNLTMLSTYQYGTTYQVEVAVKTTGDYSEFGPACTVMTPAVPGMMNCGMTIASPSTILSTTSLNYAQMYKFELTDQSDMSVIEIERPIQWFKFSMVPGYVSGHDYSIRVAIKSSGSYSDFGPGCVFKAPGPPAALTSTPAVSASQKAMASPNPYVANFNLALESKTEQPITVQVYDMIGNMVENRQVDAAALETQEFGTGFKQGVYNVIIKQGDTVKTLKVIKR